MSTTRAKASHARTSRAKTTPASAQSSSPLDLAIIGSGPAALSAALYAARAGHRVAVFERSNIGGALFEIAQISNYPGYTGPGRDLAATMRHQAESAGAAINYGECTTIRRLDPATLTPVAPSASVDPPAPTNASASVDSSTLTNASAAVNPSASDRPALFELTIDGEPVRARAVLLATGSEPRPLTFTLAVPVSYCALCDADLAQGQDIAVIGGGNSAVQESLGLAPLVKSLTLISHSALKAEPHLQSQLRALSNVVVREHLEPTPKLLNTFDRVFIFIGKRPATTCVASLAASTPDFYDAAGYIRTTPASVDAPRTVSAPVDTSPANSSAASTTPSHQTLIPGLYVAGDLRSGSVRQVVTAAGDGAAAAVEISQFLRTA